MPVLCGAVLVSNSMGGDWSLLAERRHLDAVLYTLSEDWYDIAMAGHSKHDITMNTYVHPKKENVARAGQMMDALLGSYAKAV